MPLFIANINPADIAMKNTDKIKSVVVNCSADKYLYSGGGALLIVKNGNNKIINGNVINSSDKENDEPAARHVYIITSSHGIKNIVMKKIIRGLNKNSFW